LRDLVRRRGAELDHAHHLVDAGAAGRTRLARRVLVDGERVDFRRAVMIDEEVGLERRVERLEQAVGHGRARKAELAHGAHVAGGEARVTDQVMIERRTR
jgi:hypothetical protein